MKMEWRRMQKEILCLLIFVFCNPQYVSNASYELHMINGFLVWTVLRVIHVSNLYYWNWNVQITNEIFLKGGPSLVSVVSLETVYPFNIFFFFCVFGIGHYLRIKQNLVLIGKWCHIEIYYILSCVNMLFVF